MIYLSPSGKGSVAVLRDDGKLLHKPTLIKDFVHIAVTSAYYPEYAINNNLWAPGLDISQINNNCPINKENLRFVLYCGIKSRNKNLDKFLSIIKKIESRIGIDGSSSGIIPDNSIGSNKSSGPIVVTAPYFWIKSPVTISAYINFLRLSIRMHTDDSLDSFMSRMMDREKSKNVDAAYLRCAAKNNNLFGLMNKTLPCINRDGISDHLLNTGSNRSFAWYSAVWDSIFPYIEEKLIDLRISSESNITKQMAAVEGLNV